MGKSTTTTLLACILATTTPLWAQEVEKATTQPTSSTQSAANNLAMATVHSLFASSMTATGRVQALTSARIGPRVSGRLATFGEVDGHAVEVGMRVTKGQKLFTLDQTTFENALALSQAQLASAKANLENLTAPTREEKIEQLKQDVAQLQAREADKAKERDRYKRLVEEEKTLPLRRLEEVEVDLTALTAQRKQAEARLLEAQHGPTPTEIAVAAARVKEAEAALQIAQSDLRDATVYAPFDGVITQRFKSVGDYLVNMPPTDVLELVNLDRLEAELAVPESYLPALRSADTRVTIKSPLLSKPLSLPVTRIVEQVDPTHGTVAIRIRVPADQRDGILPGAFVTAELPLQSSAGGVIVPARSIVYSQDKAFVYVSKSGSTTKQQVQLGDKLSEGIIVTGLQDGDQIVLNPEGQH